MQFLPTTGLRYAIEASANLVNWTPIIVFTNSSRTTPWADLEATNYLQRFYRAVQRQ